MKHHIGILLQLFVLATLPVLIWWQLTFGFRLLVMPTACVIGMVIFWVGTRLRES